MSTSSEHPVFIRNVEYAADAEEVAEAFERLVGGVAGCYLLQSENEPRHRGYGFVYFRDREHQQCALNLKRRVLVGGRPIDVRVAQPRKQNPSAKEKEFVKSR
jgi:RNA recognition motif-containing protein